MQTALRATFIGMLAPLMWGMSVGLVRGISEDFGYATGLCLMYVAALLFLLAILGRPQLRKFSKKYLLLGVGSANISATCFATSIALSDGGTQTMQVGMVNYLWPSLTVMLAILLTPQKARWWVFPGFALCLYGIVTVLGGEAGFSPTEFYNNVLKNPWSYGIALCGAITWSLFNVFTSMWAKGQNPTVIVFTFDLLIFFTLSMLGADSLTPTVSIDPTWRGILSICMAAFTTGAGYLCWSYGAIHGNITLMAIASYFTPVLSCVFGTLWIGAELTGTFWYGVSFVVAGSLLCWSATQFTKKETTTTITTKA